ncbi:MAG TPA: ATP-binding protein [Blastocatellia bacterium]|nr:ATP-binding protein [Blastocatellia bacterium]
MKLHTKTTLLASTITVAVLIAALVTISARVVDVVHEDQKERARLWAVNLAGHITDLPSPQADEDFIRAAKLIRGGRPGIVGVRVWKLAADTFVVQVAAPESIPAEAIPADVQPTLRSGQVAEIMSENYSGPNDSHYHVYAPIPGPGQITGAVEVIERLDDLPTVVLSYARSALWLALTAVALITLSTYLLFRQLVYRPIEGLLEVITRARAGELDVQAPARPLDEIGRLTQKFNSLLGRIHEMTSERERQQEILRERVREATAQLQQRNEELEATNLELWQTSRRLTQLERLAAAGQTAAKFAHEVGTPLNLISCHVQLLRDELYKDPESADARTEIISEQIDRIERIVRQMLDRTRMESAELVPLDLNQLLERICAATMPTLEARGVECGKSFDKTLPPIVGDADRLQQVFINLVNNALDAMPDGGSLHLATRRLGPIEGNGHGPHILVEITDTGCGMNAETRAHIFDPLYTTKERGRGTGLGLVVVRQVMLEHKGEIEVESEPGKGTSFRLRFPVAGT